MRKFNSFLSDNSDTISHFDAVVGFLRASGYFELQPLFEKMNKVRVLVGIDTDKYVAEALRKGLLFNGASSKSVREEYVSKVRQDIEAAEYSKKVEDGILRMVDDMCSGRLEIRSHPSKKIHAKIYLMYPDGYEGSDKIAAVITGSSNLTSNGLGISEERQYEFNVMLMDSDDVKFAYEEFGKLWEEAEQFAITANDMREAIEKTYLKGDVSPYDLYIKTLDEYFEDRKLDSDSALDMPEGYAKYDYQIDAVEEGYQKLKKYDGFFLADVVGLGKTVIATMIAKKFLNENGTEKTKILVVYPPAVEHNWKATFRDFGIDRHAKFVSNGSLKKVTDVDNDDYWRPEEYDLVLVDEAHKFRSSETDAFTELQKICKTPRKNAGGVQGAKKKVMLISATPMNNSPEDLLNQILMFQDAKRCTMDGVSNLTNFFAPKVKEFKNFKKEGKFDEIRGLMETVRRKVIKPITVRRTRTDIESVPRYRKDVDEFPKVERPIESGYELNEHLADLFERTMAAMVDDIKYARYQAIAYLKPGVADDLYGNAQLVSGSLANISRVALVKRLESSFSAFKTSLDNFRQANQYMINMFEKDKVYITPDLDMNNMLKKGLSEEEIMAKVEAKAQTNEKNAVFKSEDFKPEFLDMLRADQAILEGLYSQWGNVSDADDSKFAKFNDLLKHEFFKTDRNPGQKLVVFSESKATVDYLNRRINRDDVLVITSANRKENFKKIRENFDANYPTKLNDYNIILSTDVLAEGVNLHRANVIVNYDTPWNSTRLMQRIGRVNRIGSTSKHIYNYVFHPSREGDREIGLNNIAQGKLQAFISTFGNDNQVYSRNEILDLDMAKLFDAAVRQENEDRDLELPFYEELRTLHDSNKSEYDRIHKLSLRSRTGREPRIVGGVTLSGDTLVFLKTNVRKMFYLVSEGARLISSVDALKYFKAQADEQAVERIPQHFQHVETAMNLFKRESQAEAMEQEAPQSPSSSLSARDHAALRLLDALMGRERDPDMHLKMAKLRSLVERGTLIELNRELQRIQKSLHSRAGMRMTLEQAMERVRQLAVEYEAHYVDPNEARQEQETEPEIILSESFR